MLESESLSCVFPSKTLPREATEAPLLSPGPPARRASPGNSSTACWLKQGPVGCWLLLRLFEVENWVEILEIGVSRLAACTEASCPLRTPGRDRQLRMEQAGPRRQLGIEFCTCLPAQAVIS